ncbi:MAG: alpha/beta hydrolase [Leptothrix sp. (in: Bacteria)]|nr:alpha/beta hydrolase [Leptothrix sp. (in: b-proteobacteria)]
MSHKPGLAGRVLLLPGWQDSGPAHWQSHWERLHGFERVQQADWMWPRRGDWMARLDEVLLDAGGPAWLVAHSLGCQLVAAWAAHTGHAARVHGALLVAPPDTARADMPPQLAGWRHIVSSALPFPATVLFSDDDPFCTVVRARAMAADWGAVAHGLGALGHVNGDSGLGDWPAGLAWLRALQAAAA